MLNKIIQICKGDPEGAPNLLTVYDKLFRKMFHFSRRFSKMFPKMRKFDMRNVIFLNKEVFLPEFKDGIVGDAEEICNGKIECFGTQSVGPQINWHRDFFSGIEWSPGKFYTRYDLIDLSNPSDIKVPWEVSRCHHLIPLAKAYSLTRDPKFSNKIVSDVLDWIDKNPFCYSVNWTCAMDVAIRSVNWIWALQIAGILSSSNPDRQEKIIRSLYQHGVFIWRNLEKRRRGYSSNHYLSDLVGLVYLGHFFKFKKQGLTWFRFAKTELFHEIRLQFHPSGPNYELSTSYHRLATELVLSVLCLLKQVGEFIPPDIWYRAEKAIEYIHSYTRPDGTVPQIGDADDGRLHIFGRYIGWKRDDHRYLLALGHVLFNREEWAQEDPVLYEDCAYLLNDPEVISRAKKVNLTLQSKAFSDAGIYILRHQKDYIYVKTSNRGAYETAGWHTHNDVMSFDLTILGIPIFIDAGVGQYTGNIKERNLFRSTKMHNTVMIDQREQNVLAEKVTAIWENGGETSSIVEKWTANDKEDYLCASHNGYSRLDDSVIHRREFHFRKNEQSVMITDSFNGTGQHEGEWTFLLSPKIKLKRVDAKVWAFYFTNIHFFFQSDLDLFLEESWYSPGYKQKMITKILRGKARISGGMKFHHILNIKM